MLFLILMVIGLVGLATMAIPAFARHSSQAQHLPPTHSPSHLPAHAPHAPAMPRGPATTTASALATRAADQEMIPATTHAPSGIARWLPTPRGIFTALALFGAFGNVFLDAFHLSPLFSALAALLPTFVVERFAVRPLWNLVFRFQARPSASLENLIMGEAMAVVPFRNGRGIVSTNRDGRIVQLRACLAEDQAPEDVKVGDRLRIEDVDARNERVTVSVIKPD